MIETARPLMQYCRARGSVLILTLLVSAIIFMLAVSYSTLITMESKTIMVHNDSNLALFAADAGFFRAFTDIVNMPRSGFAPMVTGPFPYTLYNRVQLYDANGDQAYYTVTITTTAPSTMTGGNYGDVVAGQPQFGTYKWRMYVQSVGQVERPVNGGYYVIVARRTIRARVLVERPNDTAPDPAAYQGYGKIDYWSEANR
jgi:hypothetical protein